MIFDWAEYISFIIGIGFAFSILMNINQLTLMSALLLFLICLIMLMLSTIFRIIEDRVTKEKEDLK